MEHLAPPVHLLSDLEKERNNRLVLSYLTLRRLIGFTGMCLPLILVVSSFQELGWKSIQLSISNYYYTNQGDVLVGIICILAVFLFTYRGYCWQDLLFTRLAALSGLGIALFPTAYEPPASIYNIHITMRSIPVIPYVGEVHLVFAAVFFLSLSCISLFLFTRRDPPAPIEPLLKNPSLTPKDKRNLVYTICGCVMLLCVMILTLYFRVPSFKAQFGSFPIIFWLETLALEAFGISWLTKGKTFV